MPRPMARRYAASPRSNPTRTAGADRDDAAPSPGPCPAGATRGETARRSRARPTRRPSRRPPAESFTISPRCAPRRWRSPGRRRCTSSRGRSGRRAGAARGPAWSPGARRDAPSGWPSAIAPPLTLTRSGSSPSSSMHTSDCAANASLSSTRSRSPTRDPGARERLARRRHRPDAHDRRVDARHRRRHDARQRLEAQRPRALRLDDQRRRGAVVDARRVPRGHRAALAERRAQLRRAPRARCRRAGARRARRRPVALLLRHGHGHDLVVEAARPRCAAIGAAGATRSANASCRSRETSYLSP